MHRVDNMAELIEQNVTSAMYIECALVAANNLIGENKSNVLNGAGCYNHGVKQSLLLTLAMTLARLYDEGTQSRHFNTRDVASIPLLARLLKQKRCRTVLMERARLWTRGIPHFEATQVAACARAIDRALAANATLRRSHAARQAVKKLKDFRDKELAHSLMEKLVEAVPTINDLFLLMDVARNFSEDAIFAVKGLHHDLNQREEIRLKEARAFWMPIFGAVLEDEKLRH